MDFQPSAKILDLTRRMREIVDNDIIPLEPPFLTEGFGAVSTALDGVRKKIKAAGLWAPNHPPEYGGLGLNLVDNGLVSEVLGRTPLGHYSFGCNAPDAGNIETLHLFGNKQQKSQWLPRIVGGERSVFVMTERDNSGANPIFLTTTAVRDGDEWVLNGKKWFITGAQGAVVCLVMACTDPKAGPHGRQSIIIVPANTPGYTVDKATPIMGHAHEGLFGHCEVSFDNCRVPYDNLLGKEGEGFRMAQARLGPGRIHHCMRWLGICNRSLELMTQRAATRVIGEGDRRLADSDIIKAWIAESAAEIRAARLMTLFTAWRIEQVGAKEARNDISMIKYHVAEVLMKVIDRAMQTHGALGITDYTPLSFFYREDRGSRIYDGPDEVHKIAVARRIIERGGRVD
ncbi:MAG: acyl-CoA dehydrogenase family protein [Gammaproteobacteria bacterium]|nr:acyl-CoA dehydrogenase family protein [Gammaproteobacteria bacterium]